MRLKTIWSPTMNMSFDERLRRSIEHFWIEAAWRAPRRLRYWSVITATNEYSRNHPWAIVPAITAVDIVKDFK